MICYLDSDYNYISSVVFCDADGVRRDVTSCFSKIGQDFVCLNGYGPELTFTAKNNNCNIRLEKVGNPDDVSLLYYISGNLSPQWQEYEIGTTITVRCDSNPLSGQYLMFKAANPSGQNFSSDPYHNYYRFVMSGTGSVYAYGSVQSLIGDPITRIDAPDRCFASLFSGCTILKRPPILSATKLGDGCYFRMFADCSGLEKSPSLPARELSISCYSEMFYNCTGITSVPKLPASYLGWRCYDDMFWGCSNLSGTVIFPPKHLHERYCYSGMFTRTPITSVKMMNGCGYDGAFGYLASDHTVSIEYI